MRLAIIIDAFPPQRSSAAVQIRDLAIEFKERGDDPIVIVPAPSLSQNWKLETYRGVSVLRLRTFQTKDVGYLRRTFAEVVMPYLMWRRIKGCGVLSKKLDAVVWYSPSIFHGYLVQKLKSRFDCPTFLILRDIFPEWAVDMGLMKRGFAYHFFKAAEKFQYRAADIIGIQSESVRSYFHSLTNIGQPRISLLRNWLRDSPPADCSIDVSNTPLAGRKICVYTGNMGVAQGVDVFLDVAERLKSNTMVGFLFVGRGSAVADLRSQVKERLLDNVLFFDEIHPDEISGLFAQCHLGLLALDPRHRTDNIPGKFIAYTRGGLPVLACVNHGNELVNTIIEEKLGFACVDRNAERLSEWVAKFFKRKCDCTEAETNSRGLYEKLYLPASAAEAIAVQLQAKGNSLNKDASIGGQQD